MNSTINNRNINIAKAVVLTGGFLIAASMKMNITVLCFTYLLHSMLQSLQLKINGISNEISPGFLKYFNIIATVIFLIILVWFLWAL